MNDERKELHGAVRRGPGRRSVEGRTEAVLALLAGKASVGQLAMRCGVRKETIEGWRAEALAGAEAALRHGGKSPRERELEKELDVAKAALTRAIMQKALLEPAHIGGAALRRGGAHEVAHVSRQTSVGEAPLTLACETFQVARSSVYGALQAAPAPKPRPTPPDAVPPPELVAASIEPGAIFQRLQVDEPGLLASYDAERRHCRRLREKAPPLADDVVIRVETPPGEVEQIDFGYVGEVVDPTSGEARRAWGLVMALGHSRHLFARAVDSPAPGLDGTPKYARVIGELFSRHQG